MRYRASRLLFLVLLALAALTGCAHNQNPVGLDAQFWADTKPVIGVAMGPLPPPRLALTGNQGLIDLAINTAVNNTLSTAVAGWGTDDFKALPEDLAARLEAKGFKVVRISEQIDLGKYKQTSWREGFVDRDLSALKAQYGIDRLLLVSVNSTGAFRSYYSVVPTSAPTPQVAGVGLLMDTADNHLIWYKPFAVVQPAQGEWDQPGYANLSNAWYQAVDGGRQQVLAPFAP